MNAPSRRCARGASLRIPSAAQSVVCEGSFLEPLIHNSIAMIRFRLPVWPKATPVARQQRAVSLYLVSRRAEMVATRAESAPSPLATHNQWMMEGWANRMGMGIEIDSGWQFSLGVGLKNSIHLGRKLSLVWSATTENGRASNETENCQPNLRLGPTRNQIAPPAS